MTDCAVLFAVAAMLPSAEAVAPSAGLVASARKLLTSKWLQSHPAGALSRR